MMRGLLLRVEYTKDYMMHSKCKKPCKYLIIKDSGGAASNKKSYCLHIHKVVKLVHKTVGA